MHHDLYTVSATRDQWKRFNVPLYQRTITFVLSARRRCITTSKVPVVFRRIGIRSNVYCHRILSAVNKFNCAFPATANGSWFVSSTTLLPVTDTAGWSVYCKISKEQRRIHRATTTSSNVNASLCTGCD